MGQKITLTSLFERLVILETKFDGKVNQDTRVTSRFTKWAMLITFSLILGNL